VTTTPELFYRLPRRLGNRGRPSGRTFAVAASSDFGSSGSEAKPPRWTSMPRHHQEILVGCHSPYTPSPPVRHFRATHQMARLEKISVVSLPNNPLSKSVTARSDRQHLLTNVRVHSTFLAYIRLLSLQSSTNSSSRGGCTRILRYSDCASAECRAPVYSGEFRLHSSTRPRVFSQFSDQLQRVASRALSESYADTQQ